MVVFLDHAVSRIAGLGGSGDVDRNLLESANSWGIPQTDLTLKATASLQTGGREWSQKVGELVPGQVYGLGINDPLLSFLERLGGGSIQKAQLLISPDRGNGLRIDHSNTGTTTLSLPVLNALDFELGEDLVDSRNEVVHLFGGVPRSNREPQPLLATSNGGVVDGLDIDTVVGEQGVRSDLGQHRVSDQNGNDVGRTGTE